MSELPKLIEQAREQGEKHRAAREKARAECVPAVRRLEAALVEALDGEKLRGLPELATKFRAARARGKRIDGRLELAGKAALVIVDTGHLELARMTLSGVLSLRAEDADLLAEDVVDVSRTVEEVLRRHLALIERTTAGYEAFSQIAGALTRALEGVETRVSRASETG